MREKCEFIITDLSKGLSVEDVQNAALSMFSTPVLFSEEENKAETVEEFILGKTNE